MEWWKSMRNNSQQQQHSVQKIHHFRSIQVVNSDFHLYNRVKCPPPHQIHMTLTDYFDFNGQRCLARCILQHKTVSARIGSFNTAQSQRCHVVDRFYSCTRWIGQTLVVELPVDLRLRNSSEWDFDDCWFLDMQCDARTVLLVRNCDYWRC